MAEETNTQAQQAKYETADSGSPKSAVDSGATPIIPVYFS